MLWDGDYANMIVQARNSTRSRLVLLKLGSSIAVPSRVKIRTQQSGLMSSSADGDEDASSRKRCGGTSG